MSQFIKFYFTSSMLNMFRTLIIHHQEPATFLLYHHIVVCSCFDVCWSFGVAGLGWYPCCRLKHNSQATTKLQHTSKQEHTTNVVIQ